MSEHVAICEICTHKLGRFVSEQVRFPLMGFMFGSPDEKHKYPPPFPSSVGWRWMRCPMCQKRPFLEEHRIKTEDGYFDAKKGKMENVEKD